MDAQLVENLKSNFTGRICTVLTSPVSFQFQDALQHAQFFAGKVMEINQYGIWLKHLHTNTFSFYSFPIVGIVEEPYIPENDPRAEKIKEELKIKEEQQKKKEARPKTPPPQSQFIPIESLTKMVRDTKSSR
jgi:hypothetical protein